MRVRWSAASKRSERALTLRQNPPPRPFFFSFPSFVLSFCALGRKKRRFLARRHPMSTAGLSYRRPDVALLPSTSGSSSTQPQTSSSDGLLPSSTSSERMPDPAGSTDKGKGKAAEVDFLHGLPALPPVSPLVRPS